MGNDKRMRLRFAGPCRVCGVELAAKADAIYERSTKTVRCVTHLAAVEPVAPGSGPLALVDLSRSSYELAAPPEPDLVVETIIDPGNPGASARRQFERRKANREQKVRAKHPRIGGLLHALSSEPQTTVSWDIGAIGEERLGRALNALSSERLRVLHDRSQPRSVANIDHLAVTPTGIYVIDAKRSVGKRPQLKVEGGLLHPRTEKLLVGTRNSTKLVDGVLKQIGIVRGIVGPGIPIHGVLCFVEADWPLFGGSFTTRGVSVTWPKKLYPALKADGSISNEEIDRIHRILATALPPS